MKAEFGLGGYFLNPIDRPEEIIKYAIEELNINTFDTSPVYGDSEKTLGKIINNYDRNDFLLSTKTKATEIGAMEKDLIDSLINLNTDYIDVYLGHSFIDDVDTINSSLKLLEHLNKKFLGVCIDSIGVSGHSPEAAMIAIKSGTVGHIMIPHSIIYNRFDEVIKTAHKYGVEVYTMKNFASGILLGGHSQNKFNKEITLQDIMNYSSHIGDYIIPAARSIDQLKENYKAYENAKELSDENKTNLKLKVLNLLGDDICRFCNECRPCPKFGWQMSQPGIIKSLIYQQKFDINMESQYEKYKLNANDCGTCNECNKMCNFNIDIKSKMLEAHKLFSKE